MPSNGMYVYVSYWLGSDCSAQRVETDIFNVAVSGHLLMLTSNKGAGKLPSWNRKL